MQVPFFQVIQLPTDWNYIINPELYLPSHFQSAEA